MRGVMIIFSLALLLTISSLYGQFAELDTVEIDSMEWNGEMMKVAKGCISFHLKKTAKLSTLSQITSDDTLLNLDRMNQKYKFGLIKFTNTKREDYQTVFKEKIEMLNNLDIFEYVWPSGITKIAVTPNVSVL